MSNAHYTEQLLDQTSWIRKLARSLVTDPNVADDLVQDTVVSALEHRPDASRPLRAWLGTVLRNQLGKHRASEAHRDQRQQVASSEEALSSTYEVVAKAAVQRDLVESVLGLDEPYRSTILLRFFERLSRREIARRTGVSSATVNSRLTRGLAQLRTRLDREYGDRSAWVVAFLPILPKGLLALSTGSMTMSTVATLSVLMAGSSALVFAAVSSAGPARAAAEPLPAVALLEASEPEPRLRAPSAPLRLVAEPGILRAPAAIPVSEAADDGEHWETELQRDLVLGNHVNGLRLNTGAGNIVIEKGARFSVRAVIRAELERADPGQFTEYFEDHVLVSERGQVMSIEDAHAKARDQGWSVSLLVTVPRAVSVVANSGVGKVEVKYAAGSVDLNSGAGDVVLSMPRGSLEAVKANSGAGAVTVELSTAGNLWANSGAGNVEVRLRRPTDAAVVSLGSGAGSLKLIVPEAVAGEFTIETGVGQISLPPSLGLQVVEKGVVGQKSSGTVGHGGRARFELATGTGSIAVVFPPSVL